jgi:hypothetical protein
MLSCRGLLLLPLHSAFVGNVFDRDDDQMEMREYNKYHGSSDIRALTEPSETGGNL